MVGGKVETDQNQLEELVWITQTMVSFRHTLWLDITSQPQSIMTSSGQCHIVSWHSSWLVSDTSFLSLPFCKPSLREEKAACSAQPAHRRASNNCFSPLGLVIDYYDGGKDPVSKTPLLLHSFSPLLCHSSELEFENQVQRMQVSKLHSLLGKSHSWEGSICECLRALNSGVERNNLEPRQVVIRDGQQLFQSCQNIILPPSKFPTTSFPQICCFRFLIPDALCPVSSGTFHLQTMSAGSQFPSSFPLFSFTISLWMVAL